MVVLVECATRDCFPALKEGSRTGARRVSLYRLESIETSVLRALGSGFDLKVDAWR
jgi:hypothetical protein